MAEIPELVVEHEKAWRAWLARHGSSSDGVRLVLARKGVTDPTRLTYDEALLEALCVGWIDGQRTSRDDTTFCVRFTPRRARSVWSQRNIGLVEELVAAGRMKPAGLAEVDRAKADGRWERAYGGSASIEVPGDLTAALAASPAAQATWDVLTRTNRFAILYRVQDAKRPETRARRIAGFVEMLANGETPYPQKRSAR